MKWSVNCDLTAKPVLVVTLTKPCPSNFHRLDPAPVSSPSVAGGEDCTDDKIDDKIVASKPPVQDSIGRGYLPQCQTYIFINICFLRVKSRSLLVYLMSDKGYGLCGIANFICLSREFVHFHLHSALMLKIIHQTTRLRGDF